MVTPSTHRDRTPRQTAACLSPLHRAACARALSEPSDPSIPRTAPPAILPPQTPGCGTGAPAEPHAPSKPHVNGRRDSK
eukprot:scaffold1908_cov104-Isochrysis_galbana.AAC.6